MRRVLTVFYLTAALILSATPVRPYALQFRDAATSIQIRWPSSTITVAFSSSLSSPPANIKPGSDIVGALRRALAHWSDAANVRFVEAASNAQSISPAGTSGDGVSLITVAQTPENVAPFMGASGEMAGRTRVFFTETGGITEADIVLNPRQQFSSDGTPGTFDLEATFTHELGHLLGLEHSGAIGSTMQPRQGKNGIYTVAAGTTPRSLSEDDRSGARAIYGIRPGMDTRGAITGTITNATGAPLFGANVIAEETATGRVIASNITLANGTYRMDGLMPGNYRIVAEPLDGPVYASEIASQNGAYAGLTLNPPPSFRTVEVGQIGVAAGVVNQLNGQVPAEPAEFNASLIGLNGHLSTVGVSVAQGRTYTVYVGGSSLINTGGIPEGGIASTSPFIRVNPASVVQQQSDDALSVISFDVEVDRGAPAGEYSLRLQSSTGEVSYIASALRIDSNAGDTKSQAARTFVASAALPETESDAMAAGSLAVLNGSGTGDENLSAVDEDATRDGVQLPEALGDVGVHITLSNNQTVNAPVAFVKNNRVGFQIPEEAAAGTALVKVTSKDEVIAQTALLITRSQPVIFTDNGTGQGFALAFNEDTGLPGPFNLLTLDENTQDARSRVIIYGTGFRNASALTAFLDGRTVEVAKVAPAGELPGLDLLVIVLPSDPNLAGTRDFTIIADGKESNRTQLIIVP